MNINFYEIAVSFIGPVPPQYEIVYLFGMLFLIICAFLIVISPIALIMMFRK